MTDHTATDHTTSGSRRGRPILGAVMGLLLGVFVALDLLLFGIVAFDSALLYLFPVLGIALGIGLAMWAPLGRRSG